MKKTITTSLLLIVLCACGNNSHKAERVIDDEPFVVETSQTDTTATSVPEETPKVEEKPSAPSSSSSPRSYESSSYDNMRGFDPASENDMDDNGMSRYMENDDDEGWD